MVRKGLEYINNSILQLILKVGVIGVVAYFFATRLVENWNSVRELSYTPDLNAFIAIIFFILSVIVMGYVWGELLGDIAKKDIPRKTAVRIEIQSWLLKYIPGQVGAYLNKIAWGERSGISKKVITLSFIYEHALIILVSTLVPVAVISVLFADKLTNENGFMFYLLAIIPLVFVLNRSVFHKGINIILLTIKKQKIDKKYFLSGKSQFVYAIKFLTSRVFFGLGFVFVANSLLATNPGMYAGLCAIYILAGTIGMLAIFVPSGIGVREAVIVILATSYFPVEQAITLSIVARFYSTLADGILFGVYAVAFGKKLD